ncbi:MULTISPECIES: condensation domain-containing protein, partial [Niastella]
DGKQLAIGPKSSSYRQWYEALHQYGKSRRLLSQQPYWEATRNISSLLPVDKPHSGIIRKKDIRSYGIALDEQHTRQLLQTVPRVYRTEINDVLLSALTRTLSKWSKQQQILIGMEGHGREVINDKTDLSRTTGWFTTLHPLLLQAPAQDEASEWLMSIKEQLRQVPDKGIGYGVLKYLNKTAALQAADNWQVAFNYLGQLDNITRSSNWFSSASEAHGSSASDENIITPPIVINSMIYQGELHIQWSYSQLHYEDSTVQQLAQSFIDDLQYLVDHCASVPAEETITTPWDHYIQSGVSYTELRRFMQEEENGLPRKRQIEALYPLSGLQKGMLFHSLYAAQEGIYVNQLTCILQKVNREIFDKTWQQICRRHSILRSCYYYDAFTVPVQAVFQDVQLSITTVDFRNSSEQEQWQLVDEYEQQDRRRGFSFKEGVPMRISLLQLADNTWHMIWTFHHILLDGWSVSVVMKEFMAAYESLLQGQSPAIPQEDRYEDYIRYIAGKDRFEEEVYWRTYLHGVERETLLPFFEAAAERNKGLGSYARDMLTVGKDTTERITEFIRKERLTMNTLMQGVWAYLLHRYTRKDTIAYGIVVSGRPAQLNHIDDRVGMYINMIPLRSHWNEEEELVPWLHSLQQEQLESRDYEYSALNEIRSWTPVKGELFDSTLTFQNFPVNPDLTNQHTLKVSDLRMHEHDNYPLSLTVLSDAGLSIQFKYNTDLLDATHIKSIIQHFEQVLMQITKPEIIKLKDLDFTTSAPTLTSTLFEVQDDLFDFGSPASV